MSQEVAALSFSVDSADTVRASHNLDALRDSSSGVTRQTQLMRLEHVQSRQAMQQLSQSTQTLDDALGQTGGTLDMLMAKLAQTRQALSGFQSDFSKFSAVQMQVEAVGKAFGVTSTAMEAYYRQANQMGLTTQQTVTSMQRITEALQNQTAAGQQVRKVLQDYGVTLAGLSSKDANVVAQQFADKLRSVQDSVQRYQMAQVVMGPLDPDAYSKLDNPAYVTMDQRRQRTIDASYGDKRATAARNAAYLGRQNDRNDAEYSDLRSRFNPYAGLFGGMSSDQLADVSKQAGLSGRAWSNDDQLKVMRQLAANPGSAAARSARGLTGRLYDDAWGSSVGQFVSGAYNNFGENHTANEAEIQERYRDERSQNGFFSAMGNRIGRSFQNDFGLYEGLPDRTDTRAQDPTARFLADSNVGQRLASYGDSGLAQRQQSTEALKNFTAAPDRGTIPGAIPDPTRGAADGASKDALANYVNVYGRDEGYARWNQARTRLEHARDTAMVPGASQMDQQALSGALIAVPEQDRARAQRYLSFAQGQNADMPGIAGRLRANPGAFRGGNPHQDELGAWNDPALSPAQAQAEAKLSAGDDQNAMAASTDAFNKRIAQQQELTRAATGGAAAMEDLRTKQQAYNDIIKQTSDAGRIKLTLDQAQSELDEKRRTQAAQQIADMTEQNDLEAKRIATVNAAGFDPTARAAAADRAGIANDYATAKKNNSQLNEGSYTQQRLQALGNKATGAGNDIVAGTEQELKIQEQLLAVAGQRADRQAKAQRDLQVEQQFVQARADAEASGDSRKMEAIQQQIDRTKQLKDQIAQVNAEAKAFQLGRDSLQAATDERSILAMPRAEQARARALQGTRNTLRDSGLLDGDASGAGGAGPGGGSAGGAGGGSGGGGGSGTPTSTFNNNNPTNLRFYPGQVGVTGQSSSGFGVYRTPEDGVAAGLNQMLLDQDRGFSTIAQEIAKRSPPSDNNDTAGLIRKMSQMVGIAPNAQYDLRDPAFASRFLGANIKLETGRTADPGMIDRGVQLGLDQGGRGGPGSTVSTPQSRKRAADAALDGANQQYDAGLEGQRQDLTAGNLVQLRGEAASRSFIAQGRTGDAAIARAGVYDDKDPLGAQRSAQSQQQIREGFKTQLASSSAETTQATKDNLALAQSYQQGAAAVELVQANLKAETEARALLLSPLEKEARARQLVTEAASKQTLAAEQMLKQQRDQNALSQADSSLGVFATPQEIESARNKAQTKQYIQNNPGLSDSSVQRIREQSDQNDAIRQSTQRVQQYRDAWQSAETSTESALNSVIERSATAKQAVASLAKELGNMLLTLGEKGIVNSMGGGSSNWLTSLFGGGSAAKAGSGAFSFSGDTVAGGGDFSGAGIALSAAGNVFPGGIRMLAGGGLIDRPTHFYSAGGQLNMAGEAGTEAIMPLRRMADGNMGVVSSGGGGTSVQVHAPITINGGGGMGADGKMDQATARTYQAHIQQLTEAAVQGAIASEKRPGGSLYN